MGEAALLGSSDCLLQDLEHLHMQSGGKQHRILCPHAQPTGHCLSQECCPSDPCSELPQHEDYKETKALFMCHSHVTFCTYV